jgi:diacylglycerol kinase (ATP)
MTPRRSPRQAAKKAPPAPAPAAPTPHRLGGIARIRRAFWNTVAGLREGLSTESAIKQEAAVALVAFPVSFFVATDLWVWVALIGSLLLLLSIEFLNTAIERLCDHLHPERHDAIRVTKDLASASVFFAIALTGLIWIAAILARFGIL